MVILHAGIAKSGEFWLYKILQNASNNAGRERRSVIQCDPLSEQATNWEMSLPGWQASVCWTSNHVVRSTRSGHPSAKGLRILIASSDY